MDRNQFSQEEAESRIGIMSPRPRKKKPIETPELDKEFRRIAEKNLRKDRELLEKLAKI